LSRYYIDASVFIENSDAFGMISGFVELQHQPITGLVLPEMSIEEFVVDRVVEDDQLEPAVALRDIIAPSVTAARTLFKRCKNKGLFTDEWNEKTQ